MSDPIALGDDLTVPEASTTAESQPAPQVGWQLELTPFVWVPSYRGDATAGGETTSVDLSQGNAFEKFLELDFAAIKVLRATKGPWQILLDGFLARMDDDFGTSRSERELTWFEGAVAHRVGSWRSSSGGSEASFDAVLGGRYVNLENAVSVPLNDGFFVVSDSNRWFDLFVGGQTSWALGPRWKLFLHGDVGGFGLSSSSELTWQAMTVVRYNLLDPVDLSLGYRILDIDYDRGSGDERFEFEGQFRGPLASLSVRF